MSDVETRTRFGFERPLWTADGKSLVVKLFTTGVARAALGTGAPRIQPPADTVPGSTLLLYRSAPPAPAPAPDTAAAAKAPSPAAEPAVPKYDDFGVVDLASGRVRRVRARVSPMWYELSPDGRRLAYLEWGDRKLATDIGQEWGGAVWAPNGRFLAYTSRPTQPDSSEKSDAITSPTGAGGDGDADLYVVAVDGGEPAALPARRGPCSRAIS